MQSSPEPSSISLVELTVVGRSSSHFTRVVRIFAVELAVSCRLQAVRDLSSLDVAEYGGHPALKVPTLRTPEGAWYGALNCCRELARRSPLKHRVVWPEAAAHELLANAHELVLQAMSTEVELIMTGQATAAVLTGRPHKLRTSLLNALAWLETNATGALAQLPEERTLSSFEVTLYCLLSHLEFRGIVDTTTYAALDSFCRHFASRESARATTFRFDS